MARYKIIKNIDKIYWDIDCPVQVDKYNVLFDNTLQKNVLQLKLKNVSDKFLQSVYMDIVCYDDAKDILGNIKDISYTGLGVKAGESFGEKQPVATEYKDIGYIDIVITKAVFSDESVWRNENNISLKPFECNSGVKEYYGELYGQYVRECSSTIAGTRYLYEDKGEYWICSCGQPNRNESQNCISCHAAKEKFNEISNKEYLAEKLDEYNKLQEEIRLKKEKEEKEKAEREEREARQREEEKIARNKKIEKISFISFVSVLVLVVLGFGINFGVKYTKKLNQYNAAVKSLEVGNYDDAINGFDKVLDFKDSEDLKNESIYQKGISLYNNNKLNEAKEIFLSEIGYKDSAEKLTDINNQLTFNEAMRMYNAKDYENAVKEFDKIKAYKNSQTLMNNCLNVLYNQAVQNYNNDNYENLGSKFSFLAIYNYKDSQAKLNQIKNQIESIAGTYFCESYTSNSGLVFDEGYTDEIKTDYMKGKIEINSFYFTYNRSGLYKLGDDLYFKIYDSYYIETIFPNESFGHTAKYVKQ